MIALFVGIYCGLAALTLYAVRVPGSLLRRVTVCAVFLATSLLIFLLTVSLLGNPKAISLENMKAEKANVLAARMREGVAIYLWLMLPGENEPKYYAIPWDQKLAEDLNRAMKEQKEGDGLGMKLPFERSWDQRERKFYPIPQPKMPDKPKMEEKPFARETDL